MAGGEKQVLTPKEIIQHKFGVKASYRIEEVHVSSNECLYRCHLQLPDFSVVSNVFKKKKDSEQSAAELALEKLGIQPQNDYDNDDDDDITVEEAWNDIVAHIKYIFSDEFLTANHPLGGHLRMALQRNGERCGSLPVSVIATFDTKIKSRCKVIDPSVHSDPILLMSYVMKAAAKLPDDIVISPHVDSLRRKKPYPPAIIKALTTHVESMNVEAVLIQCTIGGEEVVKPVTLNISSGRYYLDIIAEKLDLMDGSQVMISRTIDKTSSGYECRVYSAIPKLKSFDNSWKAREKRPVNESSHLEKSRNAKASFLSGLDIQGDAIVASVGYIWKSQNLEHDDLTLKSFFRICCGMSPNGMYKLSRGALIAAELPFSFTKKSNWIGPFPREILCMFCHQHQLAEPIFTISTGPVKSVSGILSSYQKLKDSEDDSYNEYRRRGKEEIPGSGTGYRCEVKILSKSQDLVLDCSMTMFYEKENYAIQNASLNALLWFSKLLEEQENMDSYPYPLQPGYTDEHLGMVFEMSVLMEETFQRRLFRSRDKIDKSQKQSYIRSIPNGSMVSICYSVSLKVDAEFSSNGKSKKEVIESKKEIEFEVGTRSMDRHLESVVTQMSVGQYARFLTDVPKDYVIATTGDVHLSGLEGLEYSVRLLGVKGPTEKQIESVFFKPPLSIQRIEYAVKRIKESSASTLVDIGCGSGSLLSSLLDHPTSLQTVVGVDISQKRLARAAKMVHSKLNKGSCNLKSIILYDGSILEFDSRLHDIDIGTCLEVIEHMEEHEACKFGKTVLSLFRPKLLIVSSPNYEYNNKLFHKSAQEHPKNESMSQLPNIRNQEHKFEWTRKQFKNWASKLAKRHNYSVEFSGVGGFGEVEPGFASQIAVFRREASSSVENVAEGSMQPYKVIWEWTKEDGDQKKSGR